MVAIASYPISDDVQNKLVLGDLLPLDAEGAKLGTGRGV